MVCLVLCTRKATPNYELHKQYQAICLCVLLHESVHSTCMCVCCMPCNATSVDRKQLAGIRSSSVGHDVCFIFCLVGQDFACLRFECVGLRVCALCRCSTSRAMDTAIRG